MKFLKLSVLSIFGALLALTSSIANASDANSTVGASGYDLVSYHTEESPLPGNGNHVINHEGVNYLFSSAENAKEFKTNTAKYLPAYGGYCAYGAAVGKKFISDPNVWEIVDGTLYLNLSNDVKDIWSKDIAGNIEKADKNWADIKDVAASEL